MNREVHVRFWESPEVKVLRATRPHDTLPPLIDALRNAYSLRGQAPSPSSCAGRAEARPDQCSEASCHSCG